MKFLAFLVVFAAIIAIAAVPAINSANVAAPEPSDAPAVEDAGGDPTCREYLLMPASEQESLATAWIDRVGKHAISDDAAALASEISEACAGDGRSLAREMAAFIFTATYATGATRYDQPLP